MRNVLIFSFCEGKGAKPPSALFAEQIRASSIRNIKPASFPRACRRINLQFLFAHWALRFTPFTGRCESRPPRSGGARNAPLCIIQTTRLSSQRAIHHESHCLQTTLFLTNRLSSQRAIHFASRACRRSGLCLAVAHWALRFAPFTGRCESRPPRLSALRLVPGRCSLGSAIRTRTV